MIAQVPQVPQFQVCPLNPGPQGQRSGKTLLPLSQRLSFSHTGLASFCRVHPACNPHVQPLGAEYFLSLSGWGGQR